jgi:TfoX/Sxy family transcriptional regulator of competence genes
MTDGRDVPNRDLLDAIAADFEDDQEVTMGTMFRSPGLRVGGKIFAFLGYDGELIVKLPGDRVRELVDDGAAEQVTMGKRTMREWVTLPVPADRTARLSSWRSLAHEAHQYVDSLRQQS